MNETVVSHSMESNDNWIASASASLGMMPNTNIRVIQKEIDNDGVTRMTYEVREVEMDQR